jgi:phosphatidylglycerophosphate synthase
MERRVSRRTWFWLTQAVSASRVALAFCFVILSPIPRLWAAAAACYAVACVTDFFDGKLARSKGVASRFGGAMDVFGDRYLTVISCLYVGFRGMSLIPLAVIMIRELYSVAMRMVQIDGQGIMVQNRIVGGFVHTAIALGTLGYIASPLRMPNPYFNVPFYLLAAAYLIYFPATIFVSRHRILQTINADLEASSKTNLPN